jgi:hypothetical protein
VSAQTRRVRSLLCETVAPALASLLGKTCTH